MDDLDYLPPAPTRTLPLAVMVWFLANVLAAVAFSAVAETGQMSDDLNGAELFATFLPLQLGLIAGSFLFAAPGGDVLLALRLRGWRPRELALTCVGGAVLQVVLVAVSNAIGLELDSAEDLAEQFSNAQMPLLALTAIVGAPFAEEIFFRGLMQGSIERTSRSWIAVVVVALVFAGSHFQWPELVPLVVVGLCAGVVVARTGRLSTAIALHMGFNAVGVALLVLDRL